MIHGRGTGVGTVPGVTILTGQHNPYKELAMMYSIWYSVKQKLMVVLGILVEYHMPDNTLNVEF